ncbi:MAG: hypothetical protein K2W82_13685 [Candidatus Obscuribacterales bacterium]|nr:hypothetical protein [Candidatus Obscuribacterales bacterium]
MKLKNRSAKGQGLIEGTAAVVVLMFTMIGSLFLLLNLGMSIYYKQKVGFFANQVAAAEADSLSWSGSYNNIPVARLESDARSRMNELLQQSGLQGTPQVTVTQGPFTVTVNVTVNNMPLCGEGSFLPNIISVQDRATAELSDSRPPALLTLSVTGRPDQAIAIPAYGFYRTPFSNGSTNFASNPPPNGVAAFRAPATPASGYGQFALSLPTGNPTNLSPPPQNDAAVFGGGWTSQ